MEAFKAVEKEMKTKAFSKEGLSAASKLDPREQKKDEVVGFLGEMIEKLGHDIERNEAEIEVLHAQVKKSKRDSAKGERVTALQEVTERHKWHQGRLELLLRAVENDGVEATDVEDIQDTIKDYCDNNQDPDFVEDETMYDDFNLDEEGGKFGLPADLDKVSSHDDASTTGEPLEQTASAEASKQKSKPSTDATAAHQHRKPSQQIKSPLPTLATLNTVPPIATTNTNRDMKPAPPPAKPLGEPLRYASAAAAAAAIDKAGIGIAPLPPPTGGSAVASAIANTGLAPTQPEPSVKSSATTSPAVSNIQPVSAAVPTPSQPAAPGVPVTDKVASQNKSRAPSYSSVSAPSPAVSLAQLAEASSRDDVPPLPTSNGAPLAAVAEDSRPGATTVAAQDHDRDAARASEPSQTNGITHSDTSSEAEGDDAEAIFHLPESLRELVSSYEAVQASAPPIASPEHQRLVAASYASRPDNTDAERPRHYKPEHAAPYTPPHYPQDPLPIFDDPRLYNKIDTDSLFYSFYYRQGTYQQYLAARELKNQSWRFHKQYQTWFQRHEEPKNIVEDYEQGTYRFFDYESTWYVFTFEFIGSTALGQSNPNAQANEAQ